MKKRRPAIPASMDREIWTRDGGKCVDCGKGEDDVGTLHRDHDPPYEVVLRHVAKWIFLRCAKCHAKKYRPDMQVIKKVRRIRKKFDAPLQPGKIPYRGFNQTMTKGFDGQVRPKKRGLKK